jgi:hypothetical protein
MTPPAPNSLARHLRVPGYLFFGIAMILPVLDLLVSVYPIRLDTVVWRFGAVGLLSSAIGAPLLVLFFVFALAVFCGDKKVIMTVGVVASLIALLLVAGTGSFALDALQMKRRVQAAAQAAVHVGVRAGHAETDPRGDQRGRSGHHGVPDHEQGEDRRRAAFRGARVRLSGDGPTQFAAHRRGD